MAEFDTNPRGEGYRLDDLGMVVPAPEGEEADDKVTWANFPGVTSLNDGETVVPIATEELRAAGVDLDDPDPYTGAVSFWAEVNVDPQTLDGVAPSDIRSMPHMTQEDIKWWEGEGR